MFYTCMFDIIFSLFQLLGPWFESIGLIEADWLPGATTADAATTAAKIMERGEYDVE